MSGRQVKVKAREIRRAFGPEAVQALVIHETEIQNLQKEVLEQATRLAALTRQHEALSEGVAAIAKEVIFINARRLRDRLRWLIRGMRG